MGYSSIICIYIRGPSIPLAASACSLSRLWSFIHSKSKFSMSPNIMHRTHAIISFQGANAFGIIVFSSFFNLDMDCIIIYHQCFPFWFTMSPFIPSHSICSLCWGLACFVHPFSSVCHQSIQHNNLACIFALPLLVFIISTIGRWERPPRDAHLFELIHGKD